MSTAIDIGNGFSIAFDGKGVKTIHSVVAPLLSMLNRKPGTENLVQYQGNFYQLGEDAYKHDIYRLMSLIDKQTDEGILDSVLLCLGLLSPARGTIPQAIEIVMQVPDTFTSYTHQLVQAINGAKFWVLDNKEHRTTIKIKHIYQEGFGSWFMLKRAKQVQDDGYTLVLDLGTGTVIAALISNATGEVIRTQTYRDLGILYLANLIANDYELKLQNYGDIIRVEQVFNAFASNSTKIGAIGTDMAPYLTQYTKQWWEYCFSTVKSSFSTQFKRRDIVKVLVTGGGAHIVRPFVEAAESVRPGFFTIAQDPITDNVRGIYYHSEKYAK